MKDDDKEQAMMGHGLVMDTAGFLQNTFQGIKAVRTRSDGMSVVCQQELKLNEDEFVTNKDKLCQMEFERFLDASIPKGIDKYLDKFMEKDLNDVRYIRAIDGDILINDIKMNGIDTKLFMNHVNEYKLDYEKFAKYLDELNLKEKYHKLMVNHGIGTLWSFYYHIKCVEDLQKIIKNNMESTVILKKLNVNNDYEQNEIERSYEYDQAEGQMTDYQE